MRFMRIMLFPAPSQRNLLAGHRGELGTLSCLAVSSAHIQLSVGVEGQHSGGKLLKCSLEKF